MPHKIILTPKRIIFAILCVTIISDALIAELNVPSNITYFNDLLWVLLLYYLIKRRALKSMQRTGLKSNVIILGLFAFVLFLSALLNFVNPLLVLWATRNSLRFYVFYVACIYYLNINDVKDILNLFFIVQIINFAIALYQFFALGLSRDNLGGIFGHGNGMALNTFQAIVYTYYLAGYFYKKQPLYKVIIVAITSIIIAAMAEEKAYYDYFVIITIIVIILSRVSLKTALIVVGCAVIIPFSLSLLEQTLSSLHRQVCSSLIGCCHMTLMHPHFGSNLFHTPLRKITNNIFISHDLFREVISDVLNVNSFHYSSSYKSV